MLAVSVGMLTDRCFCSFFCDRLMMFFGVEPLGIKDRKQEQEEGELTTFTNMSFSSFFGFLFGLKDMLPQPALIKSLFVSGGENVVFSYLERGRGGKV